MVPEAQLVVAGEALAQDPPRHPAAAGSARGEEREQDVGAAVGQGGGCAVVSDEMLMANWGAQYRQQQSVLVSPQS